MKRSLKPNILVFAAFFLLISACSDDEASTNQNRDEGIDQTEEQSDSGGSDQLDDQTNYESDTNQSSDPEEPTSNDDKEPSKASSDQSEDSSGGEGESGNSGSEGMIGEEEAVNLVKEYLQLNSNTGIKVEFDHMDQEDYVIHVYEIVESEGGTTHTATIGWYIVDAVTGDVQNYMGL